MSHDLLRGHLRRRSSAADATSLVLPWRDVEPEPGHASLPLSRLGADSRIRLTVTAGTDAPAWLVDTCGPVPVVNPVSGRLVGQAARWWVDDYTAAWTALQRQLAAAYDADDRLVEVTLGAPHAGTGDPFARWAGLGINRHNYITAGYHADDDLDATAEAIAAQATAWPTTTQTLWIAPREIIGPELHTSHLAPILELAATLPHHAAIGAARRLHPGPHTVTYIQALDRTEGPTSGPADWQPHFAAAGVGITSTED